MTGAPPRVVWVYDREHLQHPFIGMGLASLVQAGMAVTMIAGDAAPGAGYRSLDGFSFAARNRRWLRLNAEVRERRARADALRSGRSGSWRALAADGSAAALYAWACLRRDTIDAWGPFLRGYGQIAAEAGEVMIISRPQPALGAMIAARMRGMRIVYYPFELYGDQVVRANPLIAAVERWLLRSFADAVVTQNEPRARVLVEERGARARPFIVHNYKPWRPSGRPGALRKALHLPPQTRIVLYEGVIVDGRWLEHLAQAVLHLPQDTVMVLMGPQKMGWLDRHADDIAEALASGRLFILPARPHDQLADFIADADVGVIIYDDRVRNNVFCEPGKLSDYIANNTPVIAPDFPTIGPVVRDHGLGACFEGHAPAAIAGAIEAVLARPRADWAPALRKAASALTWESQAPTLLAAVTGAPVRTTSHDGLDSRAKPALPRNAATRPDS